MKKNKKVSLENFTLDELKVLKKEVSDLVGTIIINEEK